MTNTPRAAGRFVIAAAVLWGTTGTAQALGHLTNAPLAVGALRSLLGAAALIAVVAWRGGWTVVLRRWVLQRRAYLAVGACCVAAYQVLFFAAVATTGVAVGTLVAIGSAPIVAGCIGLRLGEPLSLRWGVATALAIGGGALIVVAGRSTSVSVIGVLLALGAGTAYAGYTAVARRLILGGGDGVEVMAALFAGGSVLLLPWLVIGGATREVATIPGVAAVVWLGIGATAVPYVLFAHGLRRLPMATATTLGLAEPLTAGVFGVAVLRETVSLGAAAGACLIAGGLVCVSAGRREPAVDKSTVVAHP